ncbi:MAG: replication protein RepA [Candidatus Dormibacteria bacterium]
MRDRGSVPRTLTRAERKLLDSSALILGTAADAQDAAYVARELVQASLPHSNPGNIPLWTRRNGDVALAIQPGMNIRTGKTYGYPYGTIPRLLLFWITTEAVRVGDRRLELGHSLNGFMAELGLNPDTGGGKRGDAKRLRDQMERLFRSRFSLERYVLADEEQLSKGWIDMQVAQKGQLWWSEKQPDQGALWGSWIELGEDFYRAITAAPVPVDMRALRALKRSPLALDLYAWLTYEAFRAQHRRQSRFETWTQLHGHMGGEYADVDNFRKKLKGALKKILAVYPGLKLGKRPGGIEVLAESHSAIQPRGAVLDPD